MFYLLFILLFKISGTIEIPEPRPVIKNEEFHKSAPVIIPIPKTPEIIAAKEKVITAPVLVTVVLPKEIKKEVKIIEQPQHEEKIPEVLPELFIDPFDELIISPEIIKTDNLIKKELPSEISENIETSKPILFLDKKIVNKISRNPLPTPEKVKGIYMTGYSLASTKNRTRLFDLIKRTELNTVVIDIQDPYGNFMFPVQDEIIKNIKTAKIAFSREEFREILDYLQKEGIYTIARVTTFQDEGSTKAFPNLTLKHKSGKIWKNYKGISWLDMTNQEAWEIPRKKAQEAAKIGFDEIQFDYIRFPSDGIISQISYKDLGRKRKYEVMEEFFAFLDKNKSEIGVPISIDLFGATYAKYSNEGYDLSIGQRLIGAAEYFDYLSPMIYPSHYTSGYAGYENSAKYPYAVVYKSMHDGHKMLEEHTKEPVSKSRPWLQAFNLGAIYNYKNIRAQIQAVDENNGSGWILWSARNVYSQAFK